MNIKSVITLIAICMVVVITNAVTQLIYSVDPSECTNCGLCIEVCPVEAIAEAEIDGKMVSVIDPSLCTGCGLCSEICPVEAISLAVSDEVQDTVIKQEIKNDEDTSKSSLKKEVLK